MINLTLAIIILFPLALTFLAYFLTDGLVTSDDYKEEEIQMNYFDALDLSSIYN
ncbi:MULTISPECIES: hypothetical protein [Clostridia]|uniref:hypothetical protein n=1 Tax=Clostridium sp. CCUG 7971 TaxID=2811414 RepID=UPI001ABBD8A1|nr:hypothetical protein [Clostridium sp. CCUG 7971]MBO3443693.1 hypothetical protein [Clostridium sp. CCUG 7971]